VLLPTITTIDFGYDAALILPLQGMSASSPVAELLQQFADTPGARMQKQLSALVELELSKKLFESLPLQGQARLKCCQAKGAGLWLTVPTEVCGLLWMDSHIFRTNCRFRLGLALTDGALTCSSCSKATLDIHGKHGMTCMSGPNRIYAHNAVRDSLIALCSRALLAPQAEAQCFPNSAHRMDIVLRSGFGGIAQLIDVALTYPLRESVLTLAATSGADAVATAYTEVKYATYDKLVQKQSQCFTPLIFDMLGGISLRGRALLGTIATAYALRTPEGVRLGRLKFYATITRSVAVEVALLALRT